MIVDFWKDYGLSIVVLSVIAFMIFWWVVTNLYVKSVTKSSMPRFATYTTPVSSDVSKGEAECRRVLEEYFGVKFEKVRPDFLRNPVTSSANNKFNLELDCYNADLKIAVEYNGKQHYSFVPFFHRNTDAFTNQKYRDQLKRMLCRDNGVTLIEVPYTISVPKIKEFLHGILKSLKKSNNIIV
jgi:hypothetical protein